MMSIPIFISQEVLMSWVSFTNRDVYTRVFWFVFFYDESNTNKTIIISIFISYISACPDIF